MEKRKPKTGRKKILITILAIFLAVMIAGDWAVTVMVYKENFGKRFESYEPLMFSVTDFEGLQRTKYEFTSDEGQKLAGYLYSFGEDQNGIIVMTHGFGGGGHNSYMDCVNFFASHGYYVFAYDATGNDESEGEGVGGFPQGVIDLDYAITFVEESGNFTDLPIALFGHSWGGYSVCSVLTWHPEVKAVIACSGINSSLEMFEAEGRNEVGNGIYLMLPFVKLHESIQYGKYASNTAMDGFANSDAAIMIVHSFDDEVVPVTYGYEIYYETYRDDSRFHFLPLENKGHDCYKDETYQDEFNTEFDKWLETLDYDYTAEENKERFSEDKAEYIHQNLDRERWCNSLDLELFDTFVNFYDEQMQ